MINLLLVKMDAGTKAMAQHASSTARSGMRVSPAAEHGHVPEARDQSLSARIADGAGAATGLLVAVGAILLAIVALGSTLAYRASHGWSKATSSIVFGTSTPKMRRQRSTSWPLAMWAALSRRLTSLRETLDIRLARSASALDEDRALRQQQSSRIAVLEERQRIMRDIHDDVGGHLIGLLAAARNGKLSNADVEAIVSDALIDLRIAIDSMAPIEGDIGTVLGALRYRLAGRLERAGIPNEWHIDRLPEIADRRRETVYNLQRIVTESITNAIKHSCATLVRVKAEWLASSNVVMIEITDNGGGYAAGDRCVTRGIDGMRRRAAMIGAGIETGSEPGATFVRLTIPVCQAARAAMASA